MGSVRGSEEQADCGANQARRSSSRAGSCVYECVSVETKGEGGKGEEGGGREEEEEGREEAAEAGEEGEERQERQEGQERKEGKERKEEQKGQKGQENQSITIRLVPCFPTNNPMSPQNHIIIEQDSSQRHQ